MIRIGRDRFGHAIGVMVCGSANGDKWEYLNRKSIGLQPESLCYASQAEFEERLRLIVEILAAQVLYWLDAP